MRRLGETLFAFGAAFLAASFLAYGHLPSVSFSNTAHAIKPLDIAFSPGGLVQDWQSFFDMVKTSGVPVRIDGACISACTLVLTLPPSQVCVGPTARLGFHQASDLKTNKPNPKFTNFMIRTFYPLAVQEWLSHRPPLTNKVIYMDADAIVRLGVFPRCKD